MGKPAKFIVLPKRAGDQKETAADIMKMREFFGYNPSVLLEEGLTNQVKWYKDKIHGKF
jgi:nucleoside-diphosphate-sugar epimerase